VWLSRAAFLDQREEYAPCEPVKVLLVGHVRSDGGGQLLKGAWVAGRGPLVEQCVIGGQWVVVMARPGERRARVDRG
jgi:hypothetical protein